MKNFNLPWITGKHLLEKWSLSIDDLWHLIMHANLPVYNTNYEREKEVICDPAFLDDEDPESGTGSLLPELKHDYQQCITNVLHDLNWQTYYSYQRLGEAVIYK